MGAKPLVMFRRGENQHHQNRQPQPTSCDLSPNRHGASSCREHGGGVAFCGGSGGMHASSAIFLGDFCQMRERQDIRLVPRIGRQLSAGPGWGGCLDKDTSSGRFLGVFLFSWVSSSLRWTKMFCPTPPLCKWMRHSREASCHSFHSPFSS